MTFLQLRYAITISEEHSIRKAAEKLFVSQSGLSSMLQELEKEIGMQIFQRMSYGVTPTKEGEEFLAHARLLVDKYMEIENKYINKVEPKPTFSVSMQHFVFAVDCLGELIRELGIDQYRYVVRETRTQEVINDLKFGKSEVGVVAVTPFNEKVMRRIFQENGLAFQELLTCETHAYLSIRHPLADRSSLSLDDLDAYPCIIFDQESNTSFYFREEALASYPYRNVILSNERATAMELMEKLNGFAVGIGQLEPAAEQPRFTAVKLKEEEKLTVGYLVATNSRLSEAAEKYIGFLKKVKS